MVYCQMCMHVRTNTWTETEVTEKRCYGYICGDECESQGESNTN